MGNAQIKVEDRRIRLQEWNLSARIDYALKVTESRIACCGPSLWHGNHLRIVLRTVAGCKE